MSKCEICNKEMTRNRKTGCSEKYYVIKRIPYTDNEIERCHDCNVPRGTYHHPGCDWECCPICGGQIISCECDLRTINYVTLEVPK